MSKQDNVSNQNRALIKVMAHGQASSLLNREKITKSHQSIIEGIAGIVSEDFDIYTPGDEGNTRPEEEAVYLRFRKAYKDDGGKFSQVYVSPRVKADDYDKGKAYVDEVITVGHDIYSRDFIILQDVNSLIAVTGDLFSSQATDVTLAARVFHIPVIIYKTDNSSELLRVLEEHHRDILNDTRNVFVVDNLESFRVAIDKIKQKSRKH